MKARLLIATAASLALAGPARADLIGGWDFSQYTTAGFLSTDGQTLQNTLDANFSDLDTTGGTGTESNAFGTMHLDGTLGSFDTPLSFDGQLAGGDPFAPQAVPPGNDLASNQNQAFLQYSPSAAACVQQQSELMPGANCSTFAMTAVQSVSVVFHLLPSALNPDQWGEDWTLTFAGKMLSGTGTTIGVEFSVDGTNYVPKGTANLTATDTAFSFDLDPVLTPEAFVRLVINASGSVVPAIDNVGVEATLTLIPEPGTALLLLAGLGGLATAGRRRT
jgi:hypothetical protein